MENYFYERNKMMDKIKSALNYSSQVFDMATMKGVYSLIFLGASIYILLNKRSEQNESVRKLLAWTTAAVIILCSPLFGLVTGNRTPTRVLRFYWAMPFEYIVLYCVVDILYKIKKRREKCVFCCIVIAGLLSLGRQDNLTYPKIEQRWPWVKAENLYKIPQPVYELCNAIGREQQGQACYASFPSEMALFVRQYDASISLPYGTYLEAPWSESYLAINADKIDLNEVEQAAKIEELDYIVLNGDKVACGTLESYKEIFSVQSENQTYVLYQKD